MYYCFRLFHLFIFHIYQEILSKLEITFSTTLLYRLLFVFIIYVNILLLLLTLSMLFVRLNQQQMRNTGLMVFMVMSLKLEKQKTEKQEIPMVIMALDHQQAVMNLLKMVREQMMMSQQQLANVQAVHSKADCSTRQLVVRLQVLY